MTQRPECPATESLPLLRVLVELWVLLFDWWRLTVS